MKRFFVSIILLLLLANLFASENEEFRSLWVITWEHISASRTAEENKARVRTILDNMKMANMNAVLWQVRQGGTAYYNSSYEPWGYYAGNTYPGYDPLEYVIEEAHKRGMEVHAWFNVFQTSSLEPGAPAYEHPEWVCRDQDDNPMTSNRALSPGLAAVRDYTIDVAMEIVHNYDIDGLHLDYVRWNEYYSTAQSKALAKEPSYEEQVSLLDGRISEDDAQRILQNQSSRYLYDVEHPYSAGVPSGFATWDDWWRWSVTEFVKTLHDSVQAAKPWVRLSAAALGKYRWSGWQGYGTVYQDAALWYNEHYVDQLTPMHYHWTTASGFYDMLNGGHSQSWIYYIQPGVDNQILYSVGPGSYILADNNVWGNHKSIVERCRDIDWVDGFQFFSYGSWSNYNYWEEAGSTFFQQKTKVRAAKYLADQTPESPTISLQKVDSLQYAISVQPPVISDDHWFAVYRSTDDNLDVDVDEIVRIQFGQEAFTHYDVFTGNQDYNDQYHYFATMLDRYWNESEPSNSDVSDAIPSFAPQVVQFYPAEGDTVILNTDIEVTFSKTMDTESFAGQVQIEPGVTIGSLVWSQNNKHLTINVSGQFSYATDYTLTINKEVTDINGRELRGDPNIPGNSDFQLSFRTVDMDLIGPVIVYSNPRLNEYIENYDIDEIVTIAFDELVDPATVNENTVYLRHHSLVESKMLLNTMNNRSVISLQPTSRFNPYYDYSVFISGAITDTAGNAMDEDAELTLKTEPYAYSEEVIIDELKSSSTGTWEDPDWSGSTTGTIPPNTTFGYTNQFYLPAFSIPLDKKSAVITYEWNPDATAFLLREYLSGGSARNVKFDTTYVLQCYVYGDNSKNYFRFALREEEGQGSPNIEVSNWHLIDWVGWRLIEWDLSDPNAVGVWLGNQIMDGARYFMDSFQLTHDENGAISGQIHLRDLRIVKKEYATNIERNLAQVPMEYQLKQNYPNPFNPLTTIEFALPASGFTTLAVYDVVGREVQRLVAEELMPGHYRYQFDGSALASGTYFYVLKSNQVILRNKMLLVK